MGDGDVPCPPVLSLLELPPPQPAKKIEAHNTRKHTAREFIWNLLLFSENDSYPHCAGLPQLSENSPIMPLFKKVSPGALSSQIDDTKSGVQQDQVVPSGARHPSASGLCGLSGLRLSEARRIVDEGCGCHRVVA